MMMELSRCGRIWGMDFEYKGLVLSDFRHDPFIRIAIRLGIILFLIQLAFLVINLKRLPSEVPLFYSLPWGEKRLANFKFLFLLPILSFLIMTFNFMLAKKLYNSERLLSRVITSVAFVFVVFCLISLFQIIYIIT